MARFCNHCHHTTIWKRIVESRFYRTVREPLNKPELSATRLLPSLSLLSFQ